MSAGDASTGTAGGFSADGILSNTVDVIDGMELLVERSENSAGPCSTTRSAAPPPAPPERDPAAD